MELLTFPKGETIPQTVENLQYIMAEDAKIMLAMKAEISRLKEQNQRLKDRLMQCRRSA